MQTAAISRPAPLGLLADRPSPRLSRGDLRLLEALRLRVKEFDFKSGDITAREGTEGQGSHDGLPQAVIRPVQDHLQQVRAIHKHDLADVYGRVELPHALARKYPNANRQGVDSGSFRKSSAGAIRTLGSKDGTTYTNRWFRPLRMLRESLATYLIN